MTIRDLVENVIKTDSKIDGIEIIKGRTHHIFTLKVFMDYYCYPEYLNNRVKKFNVRTYEEYSDDFDVPPYVKCTYKFIEIEVE